MESATETPGASFEFKAKKKRNVQAESNVGIFSEISPLETATSW